ncbi:MAG: hypothetical protein JW762_06310 [Dehalococcoidales bacterium]|nr:hypothetical protein [Dehalococcoidales bacterium]
MEIEIVNSEQFDNLLNALSKEIIDVEVYFNLYNNLLTAIPAYREVFNESNTFWSLTLQALMNNTLICLCRVYDQHEKSLSLVNLLDTIKARLDIFGIDDFKQRLKDNPFVESLAENSRIPDLNTLNNDRESVDVSNDLVKRLIIWRHNIIVHKTALNIVNNQQVNENYPISREEISILVHRSTEVINRYSSLFRALTYSPRIIGHDDYLYVLRSIQENLNRLKQINKPPKTIRNE